jgi:4a-hydroxytetrahydrobiopterin dehydratase
MRVPCSVGTKPLKGTSLQLLQKELHDNWQIIDEHHLERTFKTRDFKDALHLTNRIGKLAEEENHHPDICLSWGKVKVVLYTHKIDGLSENDFILAIKIDNPGTS